MIYSYIKLMRIDKPIGILLLLWPTMWALWLANNGIPPFKLLFVFSLGTFFMRSAGCVINDIADVNMDGKVKRTTGRPLVTGEITVRKALYLFVFLISISASLLFLIDVNLFIFAGIGAIIAIIYPFCKRFIVTPQLVLGFAFSWGIPLAFLSSHKNLDLNVGLLMLINFLWIICYDTYYAMVDKDDDLLIGIKSTAIYFGKNVTFILGVMQLTIALLWILLAKLSDFNWLFYPLWLFAHLFFVYQIWLAKHKVRQKYFKAFLNNHWYGMLMWLAIACSSSLIESSRLIV